MAGKSPLTATDEQRGALATLAGSRDRGEADRCASRAAAILYGSVLHAMSPSAAGQRIVSAQRSFERSDGRIARHFDPPDKVPVYGVQYYASIRNMACIPY
jgi:hypothetical protein